MTKIMNLKKIQFSFIIALAVIFMTIFTTVFSFAWLPSANAQVGGPSESCATATSGMYLKLGDIKGESTDDGHKDWINLLSVSHGISRPDSSASGAARRRGGAQFSDIYLAKELDKSTPKLQEAVASGKVFPSLELELTKRCGEDKVVYLRYELKNVMVTSYSFAGSDGSVPTEQISLNFEEIKVVYTEYGQDGKKKGNVEFEWKVEEGRK
ncbi:MAG: type VI secretion system tube protein Hcp [bacterium]|nr:type VI secretion system tube protein Hcp [bacterium]